MKKNLDIYSKMTSQKIIQPKCDFSQGAKLKSPFSASRRERERNQQVLSQGAEAIIYLVSPHSKKSSPLTEAPRGVGWEGKTQFIIKDRISKSYRLPELDNKIRKRRTKSETKLLLKASKIINAPIPTHTSNIYQIPMPYIKGKKLSEHLDNFTLKKQKQICKQIGESIAKLHDSDIIHGDLTTSNMILSNQPITKPNSKEISSLTKSSAKKSGKADFKATNREQSEPIIYFIDFGLGFISRKFEDKAVDLHLLKQALEAKHFKNWKELIEEVFKGYKKSKDSKIVLERLKAVEKRGRYKH